MLDSDQVVFGDRGTQRSVVGGVDKLGAILYNKTGQPLGPSEIKSLECPYCNKLLRDPQQLLTCGHRYCKSCLERVKNKRYTELGDTLGKSHVMNIIITLQPCKMFN